MENSFTKHQISTIAADVDKWTAIKAVKFRILMEETHIFRLTNSGLANIMEMLCTSLESC